MPGAPVPRPGHRRRRAPDQQDRRPQGRARPQIPAGAPDGADPREGRCVSTTTELGSHGERIAAAYLTDAGLRVARPQLALPRG